MAVEENGGVRYSVKELVQDLTRTINDDRRETLNALGRIEAKLDAKADGETVRGLELRVAALELANASAPHLADAFKTLDDKNTKLADEIVELKSGQAGDAKVGALKRWLVGTALAFAIAVIALVTLVVGAWPHHP